MKKVMNFGKRGYKSEWTVGVGKMNYEKKYTCKKIENPVTKEVNNYIQYNDTTILKLNSITDCKNVCQLLNRLDDIIEDYKSSIELKEDWGVCKNDIWDTWELIKPVANMVLWNWGLKLLGNNDPYNLTCVDTEKFEKKLIKTIKNNKMV